MLESFRRCFVAIARLTEVKQTDGTTRLVPEVFYDNDVIVPVVLEPGEEIIDTQQASTFLAMIDGVADPSPEDLIAEMMAIREMYLRRDFTDITDKIDES